MVELWRILRRTSPQEPWTWFPREWFEKEEAKIIFDGMKEKMERDYQLMLTKV